MTATLTNKPRRTVRFDRSVYRFRNVPLDRIIKGCIQNLMLKAWACRPIRCRLMALGLSDPVEGIRSVSPVRLKELLAAIPIHLVFDKKEDRWMLMKYSAAESMEMVLNAVGYDKDDDAMPLPYDEEDDDVLFAE